MMKIAKLHSYVFYNATIVTDAGIRNYARLAMLSPAQMTVTTTAFGVDAQDTNTQTGRMIGAGGAKFWHALQGDGFIAVCAEDGTKKSHHVEILGTPTNVASAEEDYYYELDLVPYEVAESLFPQERFRKGMEVGEEEAEVVLKGALERAEALIKSDEAHGYTNSSNVRAMLTEAMQALAAKPQADALLDKLRRGEPIDAGTPFPPELLQNSTGLLGEAMKHAKNHGLYSGDEQEFVPVNVTDFRNVAMTTAKGMRSMDYVRVMHVEPPVWNPRKDDWPEDLLGYWRFKHAALGETMTIPGSGGREMIGFITVNNLSVVVKAADAITPAGRMTVPMFVWDHIADGKAPPETMDEQAGTAYNKAHCLSTGDSSITPASVN